VGLVENRDEEGGERVVRDNKEEVVVEAMRKSEMSEMG